MTQFLVRVFLYIHIITSAWRVIGKLQNENTCDLIISANKRRKAIQCDKFVAGRLDESTVTAIVENYVRIL